MLDLGFPGCKVPVRLLVQRWSGRPGCSARQDHVDRLANVGHTVPGWEQDRILLSSVVSYPICTRLLAERREPWPAPRGQSEVCCGPPSSAKGGGSDGSLTKGRQPAAVGKYCNQMCLILGAPWWWDLTLGELFLVSRRHGLTWWTCAGCCFLPMLSHSLLVRAGARGTTRASPPGPVCTILCVSTYLPIWIGVNVRMVHQRHRSEGQGLRRGFEGYVSFFQPSNLPGSVQYTEGLMRYGTKRYRLGDLIRSSFTSTFRPYEGMNRFELRPGSKAIQHGSSD